jgi:DNA polymerase-4
MTGAEGVFGAPHEMGRQLKAAIREATGGLTASIGVSATKYVAKVASGFAKPDGLTIVPPGEAKAWLAPQPVSRLWGAGPKTQARLHELGLKSIGEVADADPGMLAERLGSAGAHFYALAHARDPRRVEHRRSSKSIGSERTLGKDVARREDIQLQLRRSADTVGRRLRANGYLAHGVRVKLKTSDFQILTRQRQLEPPTDTAETLYDEAVSLLREFGHPGPFRLIGLAAYDLSKGDDPMQLELFGAQAKRRGLEAAIDDLIARFDEGVVRRAKDLLEPAGRRMGATLDFLDDEDESD